MKNNNGSEYFDFNAVQYIMREIRIFNLEVEQHFKKSSLDKETFLKELFEFQIAFEQAFSYYQIRFKNSKDFEDLKRIFFRTQYIGLQHYKHLFDVETFNSKIKSLIQNSKININIKCNDNLYETILQKEKYSAGKQEARYQEKKNYLLNIKKKNIYALPYFQEKKRRNAYNFNRSKKQPKKFAKKGKIHQK